MARYYGRIGYVYTEETVPGVWKETQVERPYYGDIVRNGMRLSQADQINDDLVMSQQISIVGDPFAYSNYQHMRYVEILGAFWKVSSVTIQYPRLILEIGQIYNGPRPEDQQL